MGIHQSKKVIMWLIILAVGAVLYFNKEAIAGSIVTVQTENTSQSFDDIYKKYAAIYGLDWKNIKATAIIESNEGKHPSVSLGLQDPDNESSVSEDGLSYGIMQVTISTANDFFPGTTFSDLNNPDRCVKIAAAIMNRNAQTFPGNLEYQVRAYNGGTGFLRTKRGQNDTPIYWQKFQRARAKLN